MKIKFYQDTWFGINLSALSKEEGLFPNELAGEKIYLRVYENIINKTPSSISQEWLDKKHTLSKWLLSFIEKNKLQKSKFLSVGCGLGIVEQPLIKNGIDIDLQECQSASIQYLHSNYPEEFKKINFIQSLDLKEIKKNNYDCIMCITSTYCLNKDQLINFINTIETLLKKDGVFIWYETTLTFNDIIQHIKSKIKQKKKSGIFWGWKRSKNILEKIALKKGLTLLESHYLDGNNLIINTPSFFGMPTNKLSSWQMMVFKK